LSTSTIIVLSLVSFYVLAVLALVPSQINYLRAKQKERELQPDVNKRFEQKSFEELQLEYHQISGIFMPSVLIASVILKLKPTK